MTISGATSRHFPRHRVLNERKIARDQNVEAVGRRRERQRAHDIDNGTTRLCRKRRQMRNDQSVGEGRQRCPDDDPIRFGASLATEIRQLTASSTPLEQLRAKIFLQDRQVSAHGALRYSQLLRRSGHALLAGDRDKCADRVQRDVLLFACHTVLDPLHRNSTVIYRKNR